MLIDNTVVYEHAYQIKVNTPSDPIFYSLDYDERSYEINMAFQHYHPFFEMCIFLDHHTGYIIDGKWYDLQCCDIVIVSPYLLHKTQYPQGAPNKRIILKFAMPKSVAGLENYYDNLSQLLISQTYVYRFEKEYKKAVFDKLNEIYYLSKSNNPLIDLAIHHKFIEFLSLIFLYQEKNNYLNHSRLSAISSKIYIITAYIHTHYQEELTLDIISKHFFISNYYLSHQFKKVTGFTLTEYVQITRIRNAQTLLLSTDQSITSIAYQCGFLSFSQFNRVFHKVATMSPSNFRKLNDYAEFT